MNKLKKKRESRMGWVFIAPALIAFAIFMFWPLAYTFYLSFFKWNMVSPNKIFVGFENYKNLLTDPVTWQLFKNTLLYIGILILLNFIFPYILAYINTFVMKHHKEHYKIWLFAPSVISLVVGAIIFQWIFNPVSGPISGFLKILKLDMPVWSKTPGLVIFVISLVAVFKAFGYNFLVLLSGVGAVDNELIEAARLENVPYRRIFTSIVAPLTSSTAIYILIMTIVQGMQYVFTPIKVLTQGGPNNMSSNIIYGVYQESFMFFDTGKASALSVITMLIFLVLLFLEFKYVEKGVHYEN